LKVFAEMLLQLSIFGSPNVKIVSSTYTIR